MANRLRLPHLRVCVTSGCNFSCFYCKPGGESSSLSSFCMSAGEIQSILKIARECGFDRVKFTGGEPLMRNDITEVLKRTLDLGFPNTEIITNGYFLRKFIKDPIFKQLSLLTVSLDSLNSETFRLITGENRLDRILKGISEASKLKIPLRLNMVLCEFNKNELCDMIDFASAMHAELKIHELLRFRLPDVMLWEQYFVPHREIAPLLEQLSYKKETVFSKERYGSPLTKYHIKGGSSVVVFDSSSGGRYGNICKSCNLLPCQDGLYALKITHEGKLKRCWGRNDINLDILTPLKNNDTPKVYALFDEAVDTFINSHLSSKKELCLAGN